MIVKHLFRLVFLICLCGCYDSSDNRKNRSDLTQFGLYIKNGPRQGVQYFNSTSQYNYRYYTMTVTNDSMTPVHLEIHFSKTGEVLSDRCNSKVFLLPRHLTSEVLQYDKGMFAELKRFLDLEIDKPVYLNDTLKPTETCVLIFGVLTKTSYSEYDSDPTTPYGTQLIASKENSSKILLKLKINDTLVIPCGHFTYIEN
jgi:hypothetical protein